MQVAALTRLANDRPCWMQGFLEHPHDVGYVMMPVGPRNA